MAGEFDMELAIRLLGECAAEISARPGAEDLITVMRRGGVDDDAIPWVRVAMADAAKEDVRLFYMIWAMLADAEQRARTGPLPEDAGARIGAVLTRIGPRMRTPEQLRDRLRQDELSRLLADALELSIVGERPETSRYLLENADEALHGMKRAVQAYERKLANARQAIDQKHRPARPHGE